MELISIALYVLHALGLHAIAKRRGIRHAWLAWIPFGSLWILGSIADDYKTRCTGKKHWYRVALLALAIAMVVLTVAMVVTSFSMLGSVLTAGEMQDLVSVIYAPVDDLYAPTEEELNLYLTELFENRLTDAAMEQILGGVVRLVGISFLVLGISIAVVVLECICMYNLFASCDPETKLVFFLVGMFVGLWGVFVFVVRNKDLGMPQATQLPPAQEPWQE